jgi:SnoaL-like domain
MQDALSGMDRLVAIAAIERLKAQRDRAADTKDWALYESLHASDHRSINGDYGEWTSAAEMIANTRKSMQHLTTLHHSHTAEIWFDTATTATGVWAMKGESYWKQGGVEHWFRAFGHYHETYAVRDGRWVFTSRRLTYHQTMRSPGAIFPPRIDIPEGEQA